MGQAQRIFHKHRLVLIMRRIVLPMLFVCCGLSSKAQDFNYDIAPLDRSLVSCVKNAKVSVPQNHVECYTVNVVQRTQEPEKKSHTTSFPRTPNNLTSSFNTSMFLGLSNLISIPAGLETRRSDQLLFLSIPSAGATQCSTPRFFPVPPGLRLIKRLDLPVANQYSSSVILDE